MRYLLDTNACIQFLNGTHAPLVARILEEGPANLAVSALSAGELQFGAARSSRPKQNAARVDAFLRELSVVPFAHGDSTRFGRLKAAGASRGVKVGDFDVAIAATAIGLGLVVVTNDGDFGRIEGLATEDWTRL